MMELFPARGRAAESPHRRARRGLVRSRTPTASASRFRGFPDWLYDDNPWNDYLYLLNVGTLEIAVRQLGYQLGLYRERVRFDGFEVFTPPETQLRPGARAAAHLDGADARRIAAANPPRTLTERSKRRLRFLRSPWLDAMLGRTAGVEQKRARIHAGAHRGTAVAGTAQTPPSRANARTVSTPSRGEHGATVIDWRIASPITRDDLKLLGLAALPPADCAAIRARADRRG